MVHKAYIFQNVDNVLTPFDYTDHLTVSNGTYAGKNCTLYSLPSISTSNIRYVSSYQIEELNASHEYHIKFQSSSNIISETNMCLVSLVFYNGDEILKTQNLGGCNFPNDQWQEVEFDFVPDTSGLGGYKTRIEFQFISYSNTNSVTYRLSDFIEFEDKDDNAGWFQKIINAIKEIPEKIGDLRDSINNYFSNLGDRITSKFESVGTSITNKFEEVKNAIGSWFTEIGDKLSNKFAEVGNSITSKFQEIGAEFSATFDKFKPRFYEVFDWTLGVLNPDGTIDNFYYEDLGLAITSNAFFIPNGSKYIVNLTSSDLFNSSLFNDFIFEISFIDDGKIITSFSDSMLNFIEFYPDGFELTSGVSYYFSIQNFAWDSFESYFGTYDLDDLCNSVVQVYADEGWLTAFGQMILNGIKGFFVPSPDYFDTVYNRVTDLFESKFGIFAQTTTLFFDILREIEDVFDTDSYQFVFPEISVPIGDITITIIERQTVDMNQWLDGDGFGSKLYDIYNLCVWAIIIYCVLVYALRVESTIFGSSKGIDWDLELHHSPDTSADSSDVPFGRRH